MKRILQESFFRRLHTLLLLAVMFVVGGTAWADHIVEIDTYNCGKDNNTYTLASEDGTLSATGFCYNCAWEDLASFDIYDDRQLIISASENIKQIELIVAKDYKSSSRPANVRIYSGGGSISYTTETVTWVATSDTKTVTFYTTSGDYYARKVIATLEGDGPQPHDYTITAPAGLNVTIGGNSVGTSYNAVTVKESDVVVTGVPAGKKAVVTIDNQNYTITITLVDVPIAQITSCEPAEGTISLDDLNGSFSQIKVNMDTWIGERVYYTSENGNIPTGFSITDGEGSTYTIERIEGWAPYNNWYDNSPAGYNFFTVYLADPITTAGTYTLNIPANGVPLYEDKSLPASTFTWTLTAATQFDLGWNFYTALGERMPSGNMKTVTGFTINAPQGTTFTSISDDVALMVMNHTTYEYEKLEGAVFTLNGDNTVTINLPETLTAPDNYSYRLAEGSILAGTLTNKSADLQARVNPFNGQFGITGLTPGYNGEAEGPAPTITFNIPSDKTVKSLGNTISINGEDVTVSATASGNVVSIALPETNPFVVGSSENRLAIPQYFVVTEDDYTNYFVDAWYITITAPPTKINYEVNFISAPEGATISIDGISGSFVSGNQFQVTEELTPEKVHATCPGYNAEVSVVDNVITVTFTERVAPNVAEVNVSKSGTFTFGDEFYTATLTGFLQNINYGAVSNYGSNTIAISTTAGNIAKVELFSGLGNLTSESFTANVSGDATETTTAEYVWVNESTDEINSVTFTTNASQQFAINRIKVTLGAPIEDTEYTVVFSPADLEGAGVTIAGQNLTPQNNSFTIAKNLSEKNVEAVAPVEDYYNDDVTYNEENHTFSVTYHPYTKYSVAVAPGSEYKDAEAGVVVSDAEYGNGTYLVGTNNIKSKGALQQTNFTAKEVARYDGTVTLEGNTVTVKYTEKQMPPFEFRSFTPATGETMSSISSIICRALGSSFVQVTDDKEVEGNNIYYDLTFTYVLGEGETEADRKPNQTVRAQYTNDGYNATLKFKTWYGATKSDFTFDESGTWTVNLPAGFASLTDGSKNSAATVTYTIKPGPKFVSATPAYGNNITNNDLIGGDFTMTFDKNLSSVELYYVKVNFPNGTQEYVNAPSGDMTGITVTCAEKTVTFATTAAFWNAYADRLRQSGPLSFNIEMNALTGADNTKNAYPVQVSYNYTYVAPETEVTSYNPEVGSYSLDDREYGFNNITLTFTDNFSEDVSLQAGDALPSGMTLTLPAGVTHGQIWANSGSKTLNIGLTGANVAGDYHLQIAQGTFNFENDTFGQGVNAAVDQTWTLTAATKFSVNSWSDVTAAGSEGNEFTTGGSLKKLASFKVSAPEGKTFSSVTDSPVDVTVTVGEAEPEAVSATVTLDGGKAVFTFPAPYTEEGSVRVSVPAGVITTDDALTSKAFTANFTIQPYEHFSISAEPAPETTYTGDRNTIVITLPVGKTAATVGSTISLNGKSETVTAYAIDGNTVTLTLENGFQYGSNYYSIPTDFLTDTKGDKSNYFGSWSVNVVKQMEYVRAIVGGETTTTNSVTVEKFSNVEIYFDEPFIDYVGSVPAGFTLKKGEDNISISGWTVWGGSSYDSFIISCSENSNPGTYTLHIPAGVFTSAEGNSNEEVYLDIVIPTPEYFAAMTVSPANGETMESLKKITLTAPDGVTFDNVKGLQGSVTVNDDPYNNPSNIVFADDNKSVTFDISEKTEDGEYIVTFPEGFVRSTDGEWSPELTATYTVSYPWFTLSAPRGGEVPAIENITINAPANVVLDTPAANVTIVVNDEEKQVGASLNDEGKIVLAYNATKADRYEIRIPASTFTSTTGKANKELTGLTYTIQPTLSIKEYSVDDNGNHWTTFCLNKSFTLEDGYTPYILRDNGEGGVKLVELVGTPKFGDPVEAHFNTQGTSDVTIVTGYQSYSFTTNDGSYSVTMTPSDCKWKDATGGHYLETGGGSCIFTITPNNPATIPAKVDLIGWDHSYTTPTEAEITEESISFTVGGSNYIGGLKIYPSTGTYNAPIIPANTGILVKGAAKSGIVYTPANGTKADVSGNLLRGCTQSAVWESDEEVFYKLSWKAGEGYEDLGFYWDVEGGQRMRANSGKAYLVLNAEQASNKSRMLIFGGHDEETTIIDSVETDMDNAPIYNLQGKPVSREHLPAGIYIKNGRKFIVR